MKKKFLILFSLIFLFPNQVFAQNIDCDKRYLTLVNPVRSRSLWSDQSLKPILEQYQAIQDHQMFATWLFQYDIFYDSKLMSLVEQFSPQQEKGIFLEISPNLAKDAKVYYPQQTAWFKPNAVFLSGYSRSDRKKLIDTNFAVFKKTWGFYPKSVGAWWIDSYSLEYLYQKYDITSVMIVADQLSTDNYGIWGQWWSLPYFPTRANILEPASSLENKMPITVIQWAQRDPLRAYGDSKVHSNYSIQANDYISQKLNTDYFKEITSVYLDCIHPIGQITVGLETGQESVQFINEYKHQLDYLKTLSQLRVVTMNQFAQKFTEVYPDFPKKEEIIFQHLDWILTPAGRLNNFLNDKILYNQNLAFADYFVADHQGFLDRRLPIRNQPGWFFPWWLLVGFVGLTFFKKKGMGWLGLTGLLFALSSYGLILRSYYQYGWKVYFGPIADLLPLVQVGLVILSYLVIYGWWQLTKKFTTTNYQFLFLPVLTFGFDSIILFMRLTKLDGKIYLGFLTDSFNFVGISLGRNFEFINQTFTEQVAGALLKFDFTKLWVNTWNWLILYPLIHIILAIAIFFIFKKITLKVRLVIIGVLGLLLIIFLINLFMYDPMAVKAIT